VASFTPDGGKPSLNRFPRSSAPRIRLASRRAYDGGLSVGLASAMSSNFSDTPTSTNPAPDRLRRMVGRVPRRAFTSRSPPSRTRVARVSRLLRQDHQRLRSPAPHLARRKLLRCGSKPLSAIALDCGFYAQSHFTNVFGRTTGVSPSHFGMTYAALSPKRVIRERLSIVRE